MYYLCISSVGRTLPGNAERLISFFNVLFSCNCTRGMLFTNIVWWYMMITQLESAGYIDYPLFHCGCIQFRAPLSIFNNSFRNCHSIVKSVWVNEGQRYTLKCISANKKQLHVQLGFWLNPAYQSIAANKGNYLWLRYFVGIEIVSYNKRCTINKHWNGYWANI